MAIIKRQGIISIGRNVEKATFNCIKLMGMQIGIATIENSMGFLKKLRIELPYDPAIPLQVTYLKKMKTSTKKDIYAPPC